MIRWLSYAAAALVAVITLAIPVYLVWQVMPLLTGTSLQFDQQAELEPAATLGLFYEPHGERVLKVARSGELQLLRPHVEPAVQPATIDARRRLGGVNLTAATRFAGAPRRIVLAARNGRILLLRWAESGLEIDPLLPASLGLVAGASLNSLAAAQSGDSAIVAALDDRQRLHLVRIQRSGVQYLRRPSGNAIDGCQPLGLELSASGRWLYMPCTAGTVRMIRVGAESWEIARDVQLDTPRLTAHALLADGRSLVLGAADGSLHRLFPVTAAGGQTRFSSAVAVVADQAGAINALATAPGVSLLAAHRADGSLSLHALPQRPVVARIQPHGGETVAMALAGRRLLALNADGAYRIWLRSQDKPIPAMSSLWRPLHYPGQSESSYRWRPRASQPSAAGYSLTPLAFGSIKAALAGLLLALPVALLGAGCAVTHLRPRARLRLRAAMTTLEAVPTVVLGLLAALWLAPMLQAHLGALLFTLLLLLPLLLLAGWLVRRWGLVPGQTRWRGAVAAAIILAVVALAWYCGQWLESHWFAGQLSNWLEQRLGWRYEFGNALVAGFAIGVAVAPTIYVLAEQAFAATPREQYRASLALGATPAQTLARLLLPRALPGLVGASALGFARAAGETTIVLIALTATPVLAPSLLRGLQAIGPTLAMDLPEAVPGGNLFRVLMAAALALFLFTLLINLLAAALRRGLGWRLA